MILNVFPFLIVVLLTVTVTAACSGERQVRAADSAVRSPPVEEPMRAFRARLGHTWELARLGNQDIPAPLTKPSEQRAGMHPGPGSRPTIRFTSEAPGSLSDGEPGFLSAGGWSFCNGYGTAYALGPGDQLRFRGFESTLVGCDGPDSLETRFFRALGSTRRFAFDSAALHLIAEDGSRLIFVAAPDAAK
jgi:heat shock protein HslJ